MNDAPNEPRPASDFAATLTDVAQLVEHYRAPHPMVRDKGIDHFGAGCRAFIAAATFVAVGTSGANGAHDVSPRGGPAGS